MIMKDTADAIIQKACPEIKLCSKLSAVNAECSPRIKGIIGVTQSNRAGLGNIKYVFAQPLGTIFKQSSFSYIGCLTETKEANLPNILIECSP